jgi:Zinc finger, C3HC4 type (RING finger)
MESSSDTNNILKQVAALDDADVWKQQLYTCLEESTNATAPSGKRDVDGTSCAADSKFARNEEIQSESSSREGLLSTLNQIGNALHDLECYLRCNHCASLFHAPVVVDPCHHIFCSYCIRNKFHYDRNVSTIRKASCPLCKCIVDASGYCYDRCLRPHRFLDLFVHTFREIRQPLLNGLKEEQQRIFLSPESEAMRLSKVNLPSVLFAVQNAICFLEQITKRSKSDTAKQVGAMSVPQIVQPILLHAGSIPYPKLPQALSTPRARLSSVFYNGKSKKQLVELCIEVGLSTHGISNDEAALKKRHFDFIAFYNAECDSLFPRSKMELIRVFEQQQWNALLSQPKKVSMSISGKGSSELQRNSNRCSGSPDYAACLNALKLQRKRLGESPYPTKYWSTVTTGYRQFDLEIEVNFQKLIAQYYARFPEQLQKQTERIQRYRESRKPTESKQDGTFSGCKVENSSVATVQTTLQPSSAGTKVPTTLPHLLGDSPTGEIKSNSAFKHSVTPKSHPIGSDRTSQHYAIKSILYRGVHLTNDNGQHASAVQSQCNQVYAEHIDDETNLQLHHTINIDHPHVTICTNKSEKKKDVGRRPSLTNDTNDSRTTKDSLNVCRSKRTRAAQKPVVVDTSSLIGPWICTYCTYFNTKDRSTRARCEMCSSVRVPPKHRRSSSSTGNIVKIDC